MRRLWRTGLLLALLSACACLEDECVLGVVGRPVSLPCFHPDALSLVNFSLEWRRDSEVVHRSVWGEEGNVETWSSHSVALSDDAQLTGNFSLELPPVDPTEDSAHYRLYILSVGNRSVPLCTVCLRVAARFSSPLVQREAAAQGAETVFRCHSSGGFPEPAVRWLINDTQRPPDGSVRTRAASLPDSHLLNVTSHLTVNISTDSRVSCVIENAPMNQTLTSTSYGVRSRPPVSRAAQAMWIFSTALCVVVGMMVVAGVFYQIHLDRLSKSRKKEFQKHTRRGYRWYSPQMEEREAMKSQPKETDV